MKNDTENGRHSTRMLSPTTLASNPPKEIIKKSKQTDTHRHIYSTPRYHKFIAKKRYNEEIAMSLANHRCTMLICFLFVSLYLFLIVFFSLYIIFLLFPSSFSQSLSLLLPVRLLRFLSFSHSLFLSLTYTHSLFPSLSLLPLFFPPLYLPSSHPKPLHNPTLYLYIYKKINEIYKYIYISVYISTVFSFVLSLVQRRAQSNLNIFDVLYSCPSSL